ncbi:hypothetical protein DL764_001890 [Monosporascus ibericus]|uniref:Protein kinase domain-containing protein n=1 Tax=Monosporascus ibericus TaxID=155417 RepID=A0A4Q4TQ64_9PEZI|nr:hypothetical protein DL764_001890 [Monosporascus ibericus]
MTPGDDDCSTREQITANEDVPLLPRAWETRGIGKSNRVAFYRSNDSKADANDRVKFLDAGDGTSGGMNDGIYVVRKKLTGQLFIEKNYNGAVAYLIPLIRSEINMTKDLIHNSIIHYVAWFVQGSPFGATVYMEYCDRDSLWDLILTYKDKKKSHAPDFVLESFVWHAFVGLADALGYLATGRNCVSLSLVTAKKYSAAGVGSWMPMVHRDTKPDNVFLRSSDTPGSAKPFYVVLSDFGLAQCENDARPGLQGLVGSVEYHTPELALGPYLDAARANLQAGPHTGKSDVWALACIVFCNYPLRNLKAKGRPAKHPVLEITEKVVYSEYLERSITWGAARDPADRPDGWELVTALKEQRDLWVADANWKAQVEVRPALFRCPEVTQPEVINMDPYSAEGELINIHNHFHQGQYQEVIDFDTSAFSAENALPARVLQLRAQIALGQAEDVVADVQGESEPDLVAVGALAQQALGKSEEAVKTIEELAASSGDNVTVQVVGGIVLQAAGKSEEALALLSQHSGSLDAVALITQIHLQQNRTDLAAKEVSAARRWAQDSLLVNLAESWVGLRVGGDKYQQAFYVFEELAQAPSTSSILSLVSQAVCELHLGRVEEAQGALEQAIQKQPDYAEAIANLLVLTVVIGKDPSELKESLRKTAPEHQYLVDLEEKSALFDKAAAKFTAKVSS